MRLYTRAVLVIFPGSYSLQDARDIVNKWNPDSINYDVVDGKLHIFVSKRRFIKTYVNKLLKRGVMFKTGKELMDFYTPTHSEKLTEMVWELWRENTSLRRTVEELASESERTSAENNDLRKTNKRMENGLERLNENISGYKKEISELMGEDPEDKYAYRRNWL